MSKPASRASGAHVALVTDDRQPTLSVSDHELVAPLAELGVDIDPVSWQSTIANWAGYDAVILRACWNYHEHVDAFRAWLDALDRVGARVWNAVNIARWNMDKRYLRELRDRGARMPATVWLDAGADVELPDVVALLGSSRVLIKPRIGASARGIWAIESRDSSSAEARGRFIEMRDRGPILVQVFVPEIEQGEWSFVFFRGVYSHAVLKTPAPDDIFVQPRLGGASRAAEPGAGLVEQAKRCLAMACDQRQCALDDMLYARVDAVVVDGELWLIELELMEPGLFLDEVSPDAARRFAQAIISLL